MDGMELLQEGGTICDVCGSKEFFSEHGFYYCTVCSTQSQQVREYVEEEEFQAGRMHARTAGILREGRDKRDRRQPKKRILLSRYEVFNYTLKAMTNRMLELGFPITFKHKVFHLWTAVLMRRKIAFVGKELKKARKRPDKRPEETDSELDRSGTLDAPSPSVSAMNKTQMSTSIRRTGPPHLATVKRKSQNKTDEQGMLSVSQVKKRRSIAQRKAIEKGYLEHASQMSGIDTAYDALTPKRKPQLVHPKLAKRPVQLSNNCKNIVKTIKKHGVECSTKKGSTLFALAEIFSLKTLLALIFIALRQVGCSVLFTDIIRMVWDGTLFVSSIRFLVDESLSKNVDLKSDLMFHLKTTALKSLDIEGVKIGYLIDYLGLTTFRHPTVKEFLPKFMDDLVLPRELECLIYQLEKMLPAGEQLARKTFEKFKTLIELCILGAITAVLRMLFGLDDVTEKYQSEFARQVNKIIEKEAETQGVTLNENSEGGWIKLFVIEDWIEYILYREEVVLSELFCTTMYHPLKRPSLSRLTDLVDRFAGQKGDDTERGEIIEAKRKAGRSMFQSFLEAETNQQIPEVPIYITTALSRQSVANQFIQNHPSVNHPNFSKDKLKTNFTKHRIDFVYNPEKYIYILQKAGYKVKVVKGNARTYKPSSSVTSSTNKLVLFQPYKCFDDYVGSETPSCLKFVLEICSAMLVGPRQSSLQVQDTTTITQLKQIISQLGDSYCRRSITGAVPVYPYSDSDSEAELIQSSSDNDNETDSIDTQSDLGSIEIETDSSDADGESSINLS